MKKALLFGLALLLVALVFVGCAHLDEVFVVEKQFIPAHTTLILIPVCTAKITVFIPYFVRYSDAWEVTFQGPDLKSGKLVNATVNVDETTYNSIEIGDHFVRPDKEVTTTTVKERQ